MIESNIRAGRQDVPPLEAGGAQALQYGVSITDACVEYATTTRAMLSELNAAVKARRELLIEQGIAYNGVKKSAMQRVMEMQESAIAAA